MEADIAGEPLDDLGQPEERAAMQGSFGVLPIADLGEVGFLKLMLDVEEPDAQRRGDDSDGRLDQQELTESDQPAEYQNNG